MAAIPVTPLEGVSAASQQYQANTLGFLGAQTEQGNIDGIESGRINELQTAIQSRVQELTSQGLDPSQDGQLADMQAQLRQLVNQFSNFNPQIEDSVEMSDEASEEGAATNSSEESDETSSEESEEAGSDESCGEDGKCRHEEMLEALLGALGKVEEAISGDDKVSEAAEAGRGVDKGETDKADN